MVLKEQEKKKEAEDWPLLFKCIHVKDTDVYRVDVYYVEEYDLYCVDVYYVKNTDLYCVDVYNVEDARDTRANAEE